MNAAFPGLLGRRVRLAHDEPAAWRGRVVGWDEGYLVIETNSGQLEQLGWRGVVVEQAPPRSSHIDDPGPGVRA